jgi:hypothetical protein
MAMGRFAFREQVGNVHVNVRKDFCGRTPGKAMQQHPAIIQFPN